MKKSKKEEVFNKNLILGFAFLIIFGLIIVIPNINKDEENDKKQDEILNDYKNKRIDEIQTEEKTREEVNNFVNAVFNEKTTLNDIKKITNNDNLVNYNIYYGKDSYFRNIGAGIVNTNDINVFRDKYATELEKVMKDNFYIELQDYIVTIDDAVVQRVKYKSFYYNEFMEDYDVLFNTLILSTEYKDYYQGKEEINSTKAHGDIYKLKVKALEIMCAHFDDYVNKDEYVTYDLVYRKGETAVENDYLSLYLFFGGHLYEHKTLPESEREQRVNAMVNEAIKDGTLNISNPYSFE